MIKFLRCFLLLFLISASAKSEFNIWGSAVYLYVNGTPAFYNTQKLSGPEAIGNFIFSGNLGVFGKNSGTLKILGAEINTTKGNGSSVCSGKLFYLIYKQEQRPVSPQFSNFTLLPYCSCSGTVFSGCGGKACHNTGDQKLQDVNQSVDLTNYDAGDYTLEIYYKANGSIAGGSCSQEEFDNANYLNYTINFSITSPLSVNMIFLNGVTTENSVKIKWKVENDADVTKYEIQKSDNGVSFTTIHDIVSFRSTTSNTYLFNDMNPVTGTNYYRIKSYNINSTVNISAVYRVYFGKVGNTIFVYGNSTGQELRVRLAAVQKGNYRMSVYGTNGQQLTSMALNHDGIDKTVTINLPLTLPKGIYRLFLIDEIQFYKQSFLIR